MTRRPTPRRSSIGLAGRRAPAGHRDVASPRIGARSRRWWAIALITGVLAALAIVHVRVRLIEEGYQRAAAIERREALLAERQRLKAAVGTLSNRERLIAFAVERGFDRPEQEIWLEPPGGLRP